MRKKPLYVYAMSGFNAKRGFILFIHVTEKVWEIKRHEFISLVCNLFCPFLNSLEYNFQAVNLVSKPLQYIKYYVFEEFLEKKIVLGYVNLNVKRSFEII